MDSVRIWLDRIQMGYSTKYAHLFERFSKSGVKPLHMARLQRSIAGLKMTQFHHMGHDSDDMSSVQDSDSVGVARVLVFNLVFALS